MARSESIRPIPATRRSHRLAWALLLAGGITLAYPSDDNYFDPLPGVPEDPAPKKKEKPKPAEEEPFALPAPAAKGSGRFADKAGRGSELFADVAERVMPSVVSVTRKGAGQSAKAIPGGSNRRDFRCENR